MTIECLKASSLMRWIVARSTFSSAASGRAEASAIKSTARRVTALERFVVMEFPGARLRRPESGSQPQNEMQIRNGDEPLVSHELIADRIASSYLHGHSGTFEVGHRVPPRVPDRCDLHSASRTEPGRCVHGPAEARERADARTHRGTRAARPPVTGPRGEG